MYDLKGQRAIVTGAGSGLGRSIASRLSQEGAAVIAADIQEEAVKEWVKETQSRGGRALAVQVDVTDERDVERMVQLGMDHFGPIDILVNNAGVAGASPILELSEKEWDRIHQINLKGTFLCSKAVARAMIPRKRGRIVNIASIAGKRGVEYLEAYCASKFGVIGFTQALARELGRHGITVNAVCPGYIWTPLWEKLAQDLKDSNPAMRDQSLREVFETRMQAATPLGRAQTGEDVAALVAFLVSGEAQNITGQAINVDGGAVMH